jgi:hypothetical protein
MSDPRKPIKVSPETWKSIKKFQSKMLDETGAEPTQGDLLAEAWAFFSKAKSGETVKVVNSDELEVHPNSKALGKVLALTENQYQHLKQAQQSIIDILQDVRPTEGKNAGLDNAGGRDNVTSLPEPAQSPKRREKKA